MRLELESEDHEEVVDPAEDVMVWGRVVYVRHPLRTKKGGGI